MPADDKRRARLNLIRHLLDQIPYRKVEVDLPKIPKAQGGRSTPRTAWAPTSCPTGLTGGAVDPAVVHQGLAGILATPLGLAPR